MRQVQPGEVLVMHSGAEFGAPQACWRMHMFVGVFMDLNEGFHEEKRQHARAAFESFCLSTPWGALYHAVSPPPKQSAERMANRLTSVKTLEAWCPKGPASVREHLALTVERMARATW